MQFSQRFLGEKLQPYFRFIAMDFLDVQCADESEDLLTDNLTGNQHREAGRIRRYK